MSVEPPLPQPIAAQLNHLLTYSPLSVKVERVWSGSKNARYSDRLTLSIPFCLDYIKWDVIYNALHPSLAPDVVFSLEDDDFDPLGDIAREGEMRLSKSSLCDWNGKDPSKLMALVHELRDLYTHYQRRRVGEIDDARLKFELNTMLSREGIEVCMVPSPDRPEEVKFSVRLIDTDLNKLVTSCNWKHQQKIYLQVIFPVSRSYSSAPAAPRIKLVSTPELKSLFSIEDVKLPQWLDGMCMAEYLPVIEDHLKVQVVEAIASIGARRRFIEALAPLFGRPLEVDPVFCRRATVLCGSGAFTFLVHFSIPTQFPKQQPILVMQSSQHFNSQSLPISSPPVNEYPWSPRWEPAEMAERIFEFVVDECLDFKKFCIDSSPK
ncbi:BRISC and BRCA1-A complex member 2-like [Zingiber officinale]|uniref:BRISC and BRCA1-A complex member 2-like n=1 Tax=Zingiber officinale TaxID=94328 RepID=UPI001C4C91AD|nr:BRISC and BRCA1-A complex member 2-like [Zingiber officinale]XP_042470289.1 BRISC and BRCA1-A complex member 2-like [Zingiber officinale]XP_042470290.1 BRISC and BRCA1-A complex member 2-like [Zingiber officinale]